MKWKCQSIPSFVSGITWLQIAISWASFCLRPVSCPTKIKQPMWNIPDNIIIITIISHWAVGPMWWSPESCYLCLIHFFLKQWRIMLFAHFFFFFDKPNIQLPNGVEKSKYGTFWVWLPHIFVVKLLCITVCRRAGPLTAWPPVVNQRQSPVGFRLSENHRV